MSRIVASILISVIIISLCIVERIEVNAIIADSKKYISQMADECENNNIKKVKTTATNFKKFWEKKEKILCLFYADSELDTISVEVSSLPFLSNKEDEFLHCCTTLKNRLILLKDHSTRIFG